MDDGISVADDEEEDGEMKGGLIYTNHQVQISRNILSFP